MMSSPLSYILLSYQVAFLLHYLLVLDISCIHISFCCLLLSPVDIKSLVTCSLISVNFLYSLGKADLGGINVSPSCPRDTQNYENWVSNFLNECKKQRESLTDRQFQDVVACLQNLKVSGPLSGLYSLPKCVSEYFLKLTISLGNVHVQLQVRSLICSYLNDLHFVMYSIRDTKSKLNLRNDVRFWKR